MSNTTFVMDVSKAVVTTVQCSRVHLSEMIPKFDAKPDPNPNSNHNPNPNPSHSPSPNPMPIYDNWNLGQMNPRTTGRTPLQLQ